MHEFEEDFYGSELSVCVCGYIRPEMKYQSLGKSKTTITHTGRTCTLSCFQWKSNGQIYIVPHK